MITEYNKLMEDIDLVIGKLQFSINVMQGGIKMEKLQDIKGKKPVIKKKPQLLK